MQGIDYSARISGAIVKAAGYQHVFRYLGDPSQWEKAITLSEANDLRANDITVHLNYEQTANFMLGGYAAGRSFAQEARKWAMITGFGPSQPIIYSADFQANVGQEATCLQFLQGAADVDGGRQNVGVYGQYQLIKEAIDKGYIGWQTNATAWSDGLVESRAIAWQSGQIYVGGVKCDINHMNDNYIQGSNNVSGPIPQSIRDKWPAIAGQFTGSYDDSTAILWADAGARYAAQRADDIMNKLNTLPQVSGVNLSAADIDAIASAVAKKLSRDLAAG